MIVGLVGFIGSGKGTAGELLNELGFTSKSFAGPVKDVAASMFGWERALLEGDTDYSRNFRETPCPFWSKKMGKPFTPREALQKIGTEVGRNIFHSNLWVDKLENSLDNDKHYVITDVRFPNEIDWIHDQGGVVIEIQRGKNPFWYNKLTDNTIEDKQTFMKQFDIHYSEWAWINHNIDAIVRNDDTLDELQTTLINVLTTYFGSTIIDELLYDGEKNATF